MRFGDNDTLKQTAAAARNPPSTSSREEIYTCVNPFSLPLSVTQKGVRAPSRPLPQTSYECLRSCGHTDAPIIRWPGCICYGTFTGLHSRRVFHYGFAYFQSVNEIQLQNDCVSTERCYMTKQDMFSLLALCHSMKPGTRCYEFWQVSLALLLIVIANRRQCRCDMGKERTWWTWYMVVY